MTFGRKIEFLSIPYYISGCRTWMYGRRSRRKAGRERGNKGTEDDLLCVRPESSGTVYKDVQGYLETLFSDNQSYTINFFIRAHAIINASNKLQANTTYKSFAQYITPTNPDLQK